MCDKNTSIAFLRSCLTEQNPFISTAGLLEWLEECRANTTVNVELTSFTKLDKWYFDNNQESLRHETGRFFSIEGLGIKTTWGDKTEWSQPIINQPEVGYLGIITKEIDGILYFLMQAKIEPGNINIVQLSPTIQATRSNYTQAHKGKGQIFLKHFLERDANKVLVDQLQSEQGARFFRKRNRNIIILTKKEIEFDGNYQWLTLGQIKKLLLLDNIVNMDTRTVVSGIPFGNFGNTDNLFELIRCYGLDSSRFPFSMLESMLDTQRTAHSFDDILAWFTNEKQKYELTLTRTPLKDLDEWEIDSDCIEHKEKKYFRVIPVKVSIVGREVQSWCQPMMEPVQSGLIAFMVKKINGIYHFLVQAKFECGNFDILELAPTVQCITGNYRNSAATTLPFLEEILTAGKSQIKFDQMLSEEGGRFYHEQNRNIIVEVDEASHKTVPSNYKWMTLNQLAAFIKFNNYLNIQARSLISAINFA